jgi:hypothetical protein
MENPILGNFNRVPLIQVVYPEKVKGCFNRSIITGTRDGGEKGSRGRGVILLIPLILLILLLPQN